MAQIGPRTKDVRVLLVDAHLLVRAGLRLLIERQPGFAVVGEANSATEALQIAAKEKPDVILFEPNPNDCNSLHLLPDLLVAAATARVLLVTAVADSQMHQQAVALGAMGIVLKDQPAPVLIRAIEKVHAGEVWLSRTMTAEVLTRFTRERSPKPVDPEAVKIGFLSQREREIVSLIGQGLKNKQIAKTLSISEVTVRHHLTSIFSKLDISDRLELIIYAYQHGLAKLPPE
jgi:two-component system nitrate/nitrite response regulator NarL